MNALLELDRSLFRLLNGRLHNSLFDAVLPFLRNSLTWLPLYLFLFVFVLVNFRKRWWIVGYAISTATLTDTLSSTIIKNLIYRQRPCSDPDLEGQVRFIVSYCPMSSSFTSSHAANHFGIATFLFLLLRPFIGRWAWGFIIWAAAIGYAQIYVGVHYPGDILGGIAVGVLTGWMLYRLFCYHPGALTHDDLFASVAAGRKVSQKDAL
ncbi:MAG: phosphatase PAP2 family protein [Chitinophagaceae bacterium]|nr:MAG: phosphatase PAP2 family protein [Chitinophagaceae bacterium]